jgi:hypothetical protein
MMANAADTPNLPVEERTTRIQARSGRRRDCYAGIARYQNKIQDGCQMVLNLVVLNRFLRTLFWDNYILKKSGLNPDFLRMGEV